MQIMLNKIVAMKKIIDFETPELADFMLCNSYIRKEVWKFNSFLISEWKSHWTETAENNEQNIFLDCAEQDITMKIYVNT